ncbi:LOW QUALITY PROTEIN: hypothetical protein Q4I28_000132 [Leishmania naiffi]|uniref:Uncharacterized protein n=1 Tax=Leishmania naiffi TaxID=5678 RepID=A0AAW3CBS4_9TRYP
MKKARRAPPAATATRVTCLCDPSLPSDVHVCAYHLKLLTACVGANFVFVAAVSITSDSAAFQHRVFAEEFRALVSRVNAVTHEDMGNEGREVMGKIGVEVRISCRGPLLLLPCRVGDLHQWSVYTPRASLRSHPLDFFNPFLLRRNAPMCGLVKSVCPHPSPASPSLSACSLCRPPTSLSLSCLFLSSARGGRTPDSNRSFLLLLPNPHADCPPPLPSPTPPPFLCLSPALREVVEYPHTKPPIHPAYESHHTLFVSPSISVCGCALNPGRGS